MGDDDRPEYLDREKKSFSELDRLRRERRDGDGEPRSRGQELRAEQAAREQVAQAEALFSSGKAEREQLSTAILDARGTPALADACRAYSAAAGPPTGLREISCFLDADASDVLLVGLDGALAAQAAGTLESSAGLRTQLRMLCDHAEDAVAEAAEELLDGL